MSKMHNCNPYFSGGPALPAVAMSAISLSLQPLPSFHSVQWPLRVAPSAAASLAVCKIVKVARNNSLNFVRHLGLCGL